MRRPCDKQRKKLFVHILKRVASYLHHATGNPHPYSSILNTCSAICSSPCSCSTCSCLANCSCPCPTPCSSPTSCSSDCSIQYSCSYASCTHATHPSLSSAPAQLRGAKRTAQQLKDSLTATGWRKKPKHAHVSLFDMLIYVEISGPRFTNTSYMDVGFLVP